MPACARTVFAMNFLCDNLTEPFRKDQMHFTLLIVPLAVLSIIGIHESFALEKDVLFEDTFDDTADWSFWYRNSGDISGSNNNYSFVIQQDASNSYAMISGDGYATDSGIQKTINLTPDPTKSLVLTFDFLASSAIQYATTNSAISIYDAVTNELLYNEFTGPPILNTNWQHYSKDITKIVREAKEITIILHLSDNWSANHRQVNLYDNVKLEYKLELPDKTNGYQDIFPTKPRPGLVEFTSNKKINDGDFHHIALVIDRESNQTKLFIDGSLDSTHGISNVGHIGQPAIGLDIGNTGWPNQPASMFDGIMDQIRIFDHALSQTQVNYLLTEVTIQRENLLLELLFEGDNIADTSKKGISVSPSNLKFVNGKFGKAVLFNGNNDIIRVANDGFLHFDLSSFSISAWVKIEPEQKGGLLLYDKRNNDGTYRGWHIKADEHVSVSINDGRPVQITIPPDLSEPPLSIPPDRDILKENKQLRLENEKLRNETRLLHERITELQDTILEQIKAMLEILRMKYE